MLANLYISIPLSELEVFHFIEILTTYFLMLFMMGFVVTKYTKYRHCLEYINSGYSVFSKFPSWLKGITEKVFLFTFIVIFMMGVFTGPKHIGLLVSLWLCFIPIGISLMRITDCREVKELWFSVHCLLAFFSFGELMRLDVEFIISADGVSLISPDLVAALLVWAIVFTWMYSIKLSVPEEFLNNQRN